MQISRTIRRAAGSVVLAAGLAYPVCAAVCPKGIGGCPSPGRCFLFVDADTNSLCDYTGRTGSASSGFPARPGSASQSVTVTQTTAVPDPTAVQTQVPALSVQQAGSVQASAEPVTAVAQPALSSPGSGLLLSTLVLETALFMLFTGIVFFLIRRGIVGVRVEKPVPVFALASFFGLGISLIITSLATGTATTVGMTFALVYMAAGTLLMAYLWKAGVMTRRTVTGAGIIGALAGFVFIAPIMPLELGGIVNVITGTSALTAGVLVIGAVIAITLAVGRTFCGNICPVGSLQELVYSLPVRKYIIRRTEIPEIARLGVFVATVITAIYLIDLLAFTGLYDFFSLTVSAGFVVACALLILSAVVYRPICRFLCPFGVLFSLGAEFSIFRLRRTPACISCKKCEKTCPTLSAGPGDSKRECYLCGRCTAACPVSGALSYCH